MTPRANRRRAATAPCVMVALVWATGCGTTAGADTTTESAADTGAPSAADSHTPKVDAAIAPDTAPSVRGDAADSGTDSDPVELADADSSTERHWHSIASLHQARAFHFSFAIGGRLLVVGGSGEGSLKSIVLSSEIYDPATNAWTLTSAPWANVATSAALQLTDGRVLALTAGDDAVLPHVEADARIYDPVADVWLGGRAKPTLRAPSLVSLDDGRVLAVGDAWDGLTTSVAQIYDPAANVWSAAAPLNVPRYPPILRRLADGRVVAIGGERTGNSLEIYDPKIDRWSAPVLMPAPAETAATLPSGDLLIHVVAAEAGTVDDLPTPFLRWSVSDGSWSKVPDFSTYVSEEVLVTDSLGRPTMAGGIGNSFHFLARNPTPRANANYDETTTRWLSFAPLPAGLHAHTATLMASGQIMVVGGAVHCGKMCSGRLDTAYMLDP